MVYLCKLVGPWEVGPMKRFTSIQSILFSQLRQRHQTFEQERPASRQRRNRSRQCSCQGTPESDTSREG